MNFLLATVIVVVILEGIYGQPRPGFGPPGRGGRGGGPGFGRGGPPGGSGRGGGSEKYVSEATRTCLESCETRNLACSVLPRDGMSDACRRCLRDECPPDDAVPGFVTEKCHIEKYQRCVNRRQCPVYLQSYQSQLSRCLRCRDGCISALMKEQITKKMKEAAECRMKCSTTLGCPAPPSAACRACLQGACGNARLPNCLRNAYTRCTVCSPRNVIQNLNPTLQSNCRSCTDACEPGPQRRERLRSRIQDLAGDLGVRFMPKSSITCLTTNCATICPSLKERESKYENLPETCRSCIDAKCPISPKTPAFDFHACQRTAYGTCGVLNGCPVQSTTEYNNELQCETCESGCFSEAVKKDIREKLASFDWENARERIRDRLNDNDRGPRGDRDGPRQTGSGPRRPGDGPGRPRDGPRQDGRGERKYHGFLPAQSQTCLETNCRSLCTARRRSRDGVQLACRMCIGVICPRDAAVPEFDDDKCRGSAHTTCGPLFGCDPLDTEELAKKAACDTCVDTCIPESVKAQVRAQVSNAAICRSNCRSGSCYYRQSCDECLDKVCGNKPDRNCRTTARNSGTCPVCITNDAQVQQCDRCLESCKPTTATTTTSVSSSASDQSSPLAQCDKTCASYGCPPRDSAACMQCLAAACQGSTILNCEDYARRNNACSACTYYDYAQLQISQTFCMQCYGTCDEKHG